MMMRMAKNVARHPVALGGLCCALGVSAGANDGDPLADYVRACEAPAKTGGWEASQVPCATFLARLTGVVDPSPEERLAMFKARAYLGHYHGDGEEEFCNEIRALATEVAALARHPDVLFPLALCSYRPMPSGPDGRRRADESLISGVRATLEIAPDHEDALDFMVHKIRAIGYGHGVDAAALAGYAAALYGITGGLDAAEAAQEAALDAGDPEGAKAIRARVRRDLALDALDYGPQRWEDSLSLACSDGLFNLGLGGLCLSALETLAAGAADSGEAIPRVALGHFGDSFRRLQDQQRSRAMERNEREPSRDPASVERLRSILDAYPEPLRSSEHYRVRAAGAPSWGARIETLRRAIELDGGNLEATCELAHAFSVTGALDEAKTLYATLAAHEQPPCEAAAWVQAIDEVKNYAAFSWASPLDPLTRQPLFFRGGTIDDLASPPRR